MSKFISSSASNLANLTVNDRKDQQDQQGVNQTKTNQSNQSNVSRFKKLRQYALAIARGEKLKNQNQPKAGNLTYWESVSLENVKIKEKLINSGIIDADSEESDTSMVAKDPNQIFEAFNSVPRSAPPIVTSFSMKFKPGSTGSVQYDDDTLVPSRAVNPNFSQSPHPLLTGFTMKHRPGDGSAALTQYNDDLMLHRTLMPAFPQSAPPVVTSFDMKRRPEGGSNNSVQHNDDTLVPSRIVNPSFLLSRTPKWVHDSVNDPQSQRGQEPAVSTSLRAPNQQNTFNRPPIAITNAFRDSYYSTTTVSTEITEAVEKVETVNISMEGESPKQMTPSTPPRPAQPPHFERAEKSLLLSPKFLNPRPAPKPPHTSQTGLHLPAFRPIPYSAPPNATAFDMRCNLDPDREDLLDRDIETFISNRPVLSVKITSPIPEVISTPASSSSLHRLGGLESPGSVGSGLARIGAALLCSAQSTEDVFAFDATRLSTTTCSDIRTSTSEESNASITSILAALDEHGNKALELFAQKELGSDLPKIPSTTSAPASLSTFDPYAEHINNNGAKDCEDHESFVEQDSAKATIGSWNSWTTSLSETFSNLEHLLQAQVLDVPGQEKISELLQALAFSPSAKSVSSHRSFKSIKSLKSYNSHMSYRSYKDQKSHKLCAKHSCTKDKSVRISAASCTCPEVIPEATSLSNDLDSVGMAI